MMRTLLAVTATLALCACGTLSRPPAPSITQLQLLGDGADIGAAESVGPVIAVAEPEAAPGYQSQRFAYMQRDLELKYYGRHEWTAPPAELLQPTVVRALDRSGAFAAVVAPPSIVLADLRLDLELVRLLHDFREGGGGELVLTVRAQLTGLDQRAALATRTFEYREPAAANPLDGAAAADRALARLLEDLVAFCIDNTPRD